MEYARNLYPTGSRYFPFFFFLFFFLIPRVITFYDMHTLSPKNLKTAKLLYFLSFSLESPPRRNLRTMQIRRGMITERAWRNLSFLDDDTRLNDTRNRFRCIILILFARFSFLIRVHDDDYPSVVFDRNGWQTRKQRRKKEMPPCALAPLLSRTRATVTARGRLDLATEPPSDISINMHVSRMILQSTSRQDHDAESNLARKVLQSRSKSCEALESTRGKSCLLRVAACGTTRGHTYF